MTYDYSIFGLHLRSGLEIPECGHDHANLRDVVTPDTEIAVRSMPDRIEDLTPHGPYMAISPTAALFNVPNVARYLVEDGRSILVEPSPQASALEVRAYLLGTALGAALHQRRTIPLHVSVVASPRGLLAFSGPSGSGKSTIAAAMHLEHGWPILTDDLAVMEGPEDAPRLRFGVRRLRLWKDAIAELGVTASPRSRVIDREDKFQFDLLADDASVGDHALRAVFLLENRAPLSVSPIRGGQALIALGQCIYRPDLAGLYNDVNGMLARLAQAANAIETNTLCRPVPDQSVSRVAQHIADWCRDIDQRADASV